jgi:hypothetical protein
MTGVSRLLDISSLSQSKVGDLAVGATSASYTPTKTLDVTGAAVFDVLGVLGKGWFGNSFKIGSSAPVNTDTELLVQGSRIRSVALANPSGETICADSLGRLVLCSGTPTPINGICASSNGATPTTIPSTGLCNSGGISPVTGNGPWVWTCSGLNGGTNASCATVSPLTQPLTAPMPIFYSSVFLGYIQGGAHDGLEWAPTPIPGTMNYAVRYEMQTFNPEKNFAFGSGQCPNPMETPDQFGFCPFSANANDWVTFGIIDYSQGITTSATYNNWTSGTTSPWNARISDFFAGGGPNGWGNQTNLEGNVHNDNGCFTYQSITGCAIRVRALYGATISPWSKVIVLYDPKAPKNLICKQKTPSGIIIPQYEYSRGVQNFTSGNCTTPSGSSVDTSLRLEWEKSMRDHQVNPFLTYQVAVACTPSSSQKYAVINQATATSELILPGKFTTWLFTNSNPNCIMSNTNNNPFKTFNTTGSAYRVMPNSTYPGIDLNYGGGNINGGQSPTEEEQGFLYISQ